MPYTAPDYGVRPLQGGYAVTCTEYFIDRHGEKDQETVDVGWFPTYAQADARRRELTQGRRQA
jgi:hypothetical protein